MKRIICISGDPASGKTEAGKMLAEKLSYRYFSAGMMFRQLAEEKGMDVLQLTVLCRTDDSIDKLIDSKIADISINEQDMILDSRMAWHFAKCCFKVYLTVKIDIAAGRLMEDPKRGHIENYKTFKEAVQALKWRSEEEAKRYKDKYGVDIHDLKNYDLVIDTTEKSKPEVVDLILERYSEYLKANRL